MSNSWSKEDRVHFESSEVMKQLEKNLIDNYKKLEAIQNKIAADVSTQKSINQLKAMTDAATAATSALTNMNDAMNADDSEIDPDNAESPDDCIDYSDDDNLADKEAVIEDLRKMIKIALDEKEYDLVYKIERTIDSINNREVACE